MSCCCCGLDPFPFKIYPQKYLRGVEHAIPAVHSRRGYSVISVGSLGVLKQIKLTAAVSWQCDFVSVPFTIHSKKMSLLSFRNLPWISRNHEKIFGPIFSWPQQNTHTHICNMWEKSLGPRLDQVRQLLQSCMKFSGGSKVGYIFASTFSEIADLFR